MDASTFITVDETTTALESWHSAETDHLLDHLLLVRCKRREQNAHDNPSAFRANTNAVLLDALDVLQERQPRLAKLIEARFMDRMVEDEIAQHLQVAIPTFYRLRRKALQTLCTILNEQEAIARHELLKQLHESLPTLHSKRLFGTDTFLQPVCDQLQAIGQAPFHIVLTGLGGIGKTAAARYILQHIAQSALYDHIIWTTITYTSLDPLAAPPDCVAQVTGAMRSYFDQRNLPVPTETQMPLWMKRNRALLVIDNVERVDDVNTLLHELRDWTNPSKIIITSRAKPTRQPHAFVCNLDELNEQDSVALIRHLAAVTHQDELAAADSTTTDQIYRHTGGTPLAIELVLGLTQSLPLADVLDDLPVANLVDTEELYSRIYWRVWHNLTESAQAVFLAMPLAGAEGATLKQIKAITEQKSGVLKNAIKELSDRSLLVQRGNSLRPLYGIHRISANFLVGEVLKWQSM